MAIPGGGPPLLGRAMEARAWSKLLDDVRAGCRPPGGRRCAPSRAERRSAVLRGGSVEAQPDEVAATILAAVEAVTSIPA